MFDFVSFSQKSKIKKDGIWEEVKSLTGQNSSIIGQQCTKGKSFSILKPFKDVFVTILI